MHRYYDMAYINKMPLNAIKRLIKKAKEENDREYLYRFWLVRYPLYNKDNYESFNEFCENLKPTSITYDHRPKHEIMEEILELQERS